MGGVPWSDHQLSTLVELFNQGRTDNVIARRVKKSDTAVRNKRIKMGLMRDGYSRPIIKSTVVDTSYKYKKPEFDRTEVKIRSCLGCGQKFKSTWKGNRLCKLCKDRGHAG